MPGWMSRPINSISILLLAIEPTTPSALHAAKPSAKPYDNSM